MCMGGGGGSDAAAQARADEKKRQAEIRLGTNSVNDIFRQFNEGFFQRNIGDPFLQFSMPQFNDQRRNAFEDLVFALSGRGLLNSSVGARARNEFNTFADRQLATVQDQARGQVDQALANASTQRQNIINSLNASGDAQGAINAARSQAGLLSRPPAFTPLGAIFANFTSTYLNNRQPQGGAQGGGGGTSLFGSGGAGNTGSARVIGG